MYLLGITSLLRGLEGVGSTVSAQTTSVFKRTKNTADFIAQVEKKKVHKSKDREVSSEREGSEKMKRECYIT
jgi:hypothetical protein